MFEIPQMVTIAEAARITRLAKHFIRQLCLTNQIVFVKAGSKYLVNLDKLIDYLNNPPGNDLETEKTIIRKIG